MVDEFNWFYRCETLKALKSYPYPSGVLQVLDKLQRSGFQAYLVGGCVRDILHGEHAPKDFDVATDATPAQVQDTFEKTVATGLQHGTVTVVTEDGGLNVEVTTFRSEGEYSDGRRPDSVQFESDIELDLARRDFTINAMAYDPIHQKFVDPFGGLEDLQDGVVAAVGSAAERFAEDGLRPLRAVRFATVLGFTISGKTFAAIPGAVAVFKKVSIERVVAEFQKILLSDASTGLDLMFESQLLQAFLPEVCLNFDLLPDLVQRVVPELPRRLAALLIRVSPNVRAAILQGLKLPAEVVKDTTAISRGATALLQHSVWTDPMFRRLASEIGRDSFMAAVALAEHAQGVDAQRAYRMLNSDPPLTVKDLALNGQEIMEALKCKPGKKVGDAQRELLNVVLVCPDWNTKANLRACLATWDAGCKLLSPGALGPEKL